MVIPYFGKSAYLACPFEEPPETQAPKPSSQFLNIHCADLRTQFVVYHLAIVLTASGVDSLALQGERHALTDVLPQHAADSQAWPHTGIQDDNKKQS